MGCNMMANDPILLILL